MVHDIVLYLSKVRMCSMNQIIKNKVPNTICKQMSSGYGVCHIGLICLSTAADVVLS